jgi:CDP-glucose 4,6-dehydratase
VGQRRRALEDLGVSAPARAELEAAYRGRKVLVTGHTGFKGAWLTTWLQTLGAEVSGYALAPESAQGAFVAAGVEKLCKHRVADVRDLGALDKALAADQPEYIFHLAAQPLVLRSYLEPVETIATNVMGTVHVLDAVRRFKQPCVVVIVSSDKCYENHEREGGYKEDEPMGGHDPYSMSKGATELVTASYRKSFFDPKKVIEHGVFVASARAGNVIGGGDWAEFRIVPDAIASLTKGKPIPVRSPKSTRPWQHVLEPLSGYLLLGARLAGEGTATPHQFCEGWNFGPEASATRTVGELADQLVKHWGAGAWENKAEPGAKHEAKLLSLDIEKAKARLGWRPHWGFEEATRRTVEWYRAQADRADAKALLELTRAQIEAWQSA